jgi:hypothetical protein
VNEKINLKQIAKKAYTSYHQDGILDTSLAIVIFTFAIMIIVDLPWLGGAIGILAMSFYAGAKRVLTVPRIGYVKFPQQRAQRINIALLVLGFLGFALGLVAFTQTESGGTPSWLLFLIDNYMLTIGGIIACLFLLGGYTFQTKRMYTYTLLVLTIFFVGHFIYYPLEYYLLLLGTIILAVGIVMMIRFVSKYPKTSQEMDA